MILKVYTFLPNNKTTIIQYLGKNIKDVCFIFAYIELLFYKKIFDLINNSKILNYNFTADCLNNLLLIDI